MGVETAQIEQVLDVQQARDRELPILRIEEIFDFRGGPVHYREPRALLVEGAATPVCILIDKPDDIIVVNLDELRLMPPLATLEPRSSAFLGVLVKNDAIILLLDLHQIERYGRAATGAHFTE